MGLQVGVVDPQGVHLVVEVDLQAEGVCQEEVVCQEGVHHLGVVGHLVSGECHVEHHDQEVAQSVPSWVEEEWAPGWVHHSTKAIETFGSS